MASTQEVFMKPRKIFVADDDFCRRFVEHGGTIDILTFVYFVTYLEI